MSISPTIFVGSFVGCIGPNSLEIFNNHILKINDFGYISGFFPCESDQGRLILESVASNASCKFLPKYSFMIPTFCDLHLHAPQMLYLGSGLHLPLMEWLDRYAYRAEERIDSDLNLASRVYKRLARRLVEHGTGAALLFGTIRTESNVLLAKIFQDAGIRAFVGKLSMDISSRPSYIEPSTLEAINSARKFIDECNALVSHLPPHERLVKPVITPRFVPTCSSELLMQLGELASETSTLIQSHMSESKDQVAWVHQSRNADDIDIFAQSGLLTHKTVQAHCTFLDQSHLDRLHASGTAVAHCPLSNAYFSSRAFSLREALDSGVKIGLGTDVAGGYQLDIMAAMRMAVVVSRMRENERVELGRSSASTSAQITWKEALYLATKGGAEALGLQVADHPFQVGLPFDAQQIDLYDESRGEAIGNIDFFDTPPDNLSEEVLEKWWCLGDNQNRSAVYIQGKNIL
ncbi:Metallo-dependent hydrolase [Hysterangium stoloniferum]|nr:Metallo-dependent hydrolase [Hysterangium stoloniferum]